jgi:UDP-2,3-diacylglucosamine pyrophosphatase LpxH
MAPTHNDILGALSTRLGHPLVLVSRLEETLLRIPAGFAAAFLPDLHLTSDAAAEAFAGYHFRQDLRQTIGSVLDVLNAIPGLRKIQLGDRYDLWREDVLGEKPIADQIAGIRRDHGSCLDDLVAGRGWQFLAGNHDGSLSVARGDEPYNDAEETIWCGEATPGGVDTPILVLHGDYFDPVEILPNSWKEFGLLRVGRQTPETIQDLCKEPPAFRIAPKDQATPADLSHFVDYVHPPLPVNLVEGSDDAALGQYVQPNIAFNVLWYPSARNWVIGPADPGTRFFEAARDRTEGIARKEARPKPKLCVIGHTHDPRIVRGDRSDGQTPFVLMDCGAWVERSRVPLIRNGVLRTDMSLSAHLGIVVGCDLRIYQLVAS